VSHTQACDLHEKALAYRQKLGDQRGISISLNNLGLSFQEMEDFDEARTVISVKALICLDR